jgi:hypothetical protein
MGEGKIQMIEIFQKNKAKADKYHRPFIQIFGVKLMAYFDFLTGFDIVRFDELFLKSPDGKSVKDVVLEKYGKEGLKIIEDLLS